MKTILTYELSIVSEPDAFYELLESAEACELTDTEDEYVDMSEAENGMIVQYYDGRRKKRIRVLFNVPYRTSETDPEETLQRMEKWIRKYFSKKLHIEDFQLSRLTITAGLKLDEGNSAEDYMTVLRRVGNVKGYTLHSERKSGLYICHHWQGNSNNTDVILRYSKEYKLQLVVRMLKSQAVHTYTQESKTQMQILKSLTGLEGSLVTLLSGVIPLGMFLKKEAAVKRIRTKISNDALRQKMLRLVELIPEKKSMKTALKASGYRALGDLMLEFMQINLSPVTIGKRQRIKKLENLYLYL